MALAEAGGARHPDPKQSCQQQAWLKRPRALGQAFSISELWVHSAYNSRQHSPQGSSDPIGGPIRFMWPGPEAPAGSGIRHRPCCRQLGLGSCRRLPFQKMQTLFPYKQLSGFWQDGRGNSSAALVCAVFAGATLGMCASLRT